MQFQSVDECINDELEALLRLNHKNHQHTLAEQNVLIEVAGERLVAASDPYHDLLAAQLTLNLMNTDEVH